MDINLSTASDDFTIFAVAKSFNQSETELTSKWRSLLSQVHPDKFVSQGPAAQRTAMQWSVRINEAYKRLKDPISRAIYLCQINGYPLDTERDNAMPMEFLMQQMQWREGIEEAQSLEQLDILKQQVQSEESSRLTLLAQLIDEQHDYAQASEQIKILMFVKQFFREFSLRQAQLQASN